MDHRAITRYLKGTLGLEIRLRRWKSEKTLPAYLQDAFDFLEGEILGTTCLFGVMKQEKDLFSINPIVKHLAAIRAKWSGETILVVPGINPAIRKRLIEKAIPFIVPGNQMFVPMLGLDLREHFAKSREPKSLFSPATQVLVLNILYGKLPASLTTKDISKGLGYSIMTVNRSLDELADAGFGDYGTRGIERRIQFGKPKDTWEKARRRLRSPVRNRFREMTPTSRDLRIKGGLTALSHYSDLAEPEVPLFVLSSASREAPFKGQEGRLIEFETWRYPPLDSGKANHGYADPLSVYLSMEGEYDERISQARDQLLDRMKW